MNGTWYRDLFSVGSGPVPVALFVRVAVAVGLPLVGFTLGGHALAGVAGGATAMFVVMCDVGVTRANRVGTMLAGTAAILAGGVIGHEWGGTTLADETVVLLAALVAGWVSNSHPGISAVARFGALATAAGTGLHMPPPATEAVWAVVGGGAAAIGTAFAAWALTGIPPADNMMDWRAGVRRAFAGADAGPWYAICFAAAAAVSLLAADRLGVSNAYWATLTVIMVMRREGMVSLKLVIQYVARHADRHPDRVRGRPGAPRAARDRVRRDPGRRECPPRARDQPGARLCRVHRVPDARRGSRSPRRRRDAAAALDPPLRRRGRMRDRVGRYAPRFAGCAEGGGRAGSVTRRVLLHGVA